MNNYFIYNEGGAYVASTQFAEDAAALVAVLGDGATISVNNEPKLWRKYIVWREGRESQSAHESYDHVTEIVHLREASETFV